jgi:hypothetical protein
MTTKHYNNQQRNTEQKNAYLWYAVNGVSLFDCVTVVKQPM